MSQHTSRTSSFIAGSAVLGLIVAAGFAGAWPPVNKTSYVTFSGPVALPGVTLGTGTYIFEVPDPNLSPDIVSVLTRDRARLVYLGLTQRTQRPRGLPANHLITLGEAPPGVAPPIRVWYPRDQSLGHQFIYPPASR